MTQPEVRRPVVVDASAFVDIVVETTERGDRIVSAIGDRPIAAPTIVEYEVTNVIRRLAVDGTLSAGQADRAYARFRRIPLILADFSSLADRIWELHPNVTAMDAAYVALAEALDVELITADERLARATGIRCSVAVFRSPPP